MTKVIALVLDCLLDSIAFETGDMEEFKVNKTRESRKMAKEVKKQHHHRPETSDSKAPVPVVEETPVPKPETSNNGEIEITCMSSMVMFSVR